MRRVLTLCCALIVVTGCGTQQKDRVEHRSYFLDRSFYNVAYKDVAIKPISENVLGGIVPHHLLDSHDMASFYASLARTTHPSVIVVIGPNHPNKGENPIALSNAVWNTPYGKVEPASALIQKLVDAHAGAIDEGLFQTEHSISAEIAFLKNSFSNTPIVPIIVKTAVPKNLRDTLIASLNELLPNNALVIASVDFAHYIPAEKARELDAKSIPPLEELAVERLNEVTADSPVSLEVLLRYLKLRGVARGTLFSNKNSADVIGDQSIPEVTSYVLMEFAR